MYNGVGAKSALTVTVAGAPTGTVFNGSATDFVVSQNGKSGAARFLFATEGGTDHGLVARSQRDSRSHGR